MSEDPKLIIRVISFQLTELIRPWYIYVTAGQTDNLRQQYRVRTNYVRRAVIIIINVKNFPVYNNV